MVLGERLDDCAVGATADSRNDSRSGLTHLTRGRGRGMKRIASMLIGALFVGASFGVAMAQEGTAPANPPAAAPAAPAAAPAAPAAAPAAPAAAPAAPAAAAPAATDEHADEVAAFH